MTEFFAGTGGGAAFMLCWRLIGLWVAKRRRDRALREKEERIEQFWEKGPKT